MVGGLGDAPAADLGALTRGQDDIDQLDLTELLEDASALVSQSGPLAALRERFPQHVRQEADENVRQHAILFLVPDRTQQEIAFVNAERRLGSAP